jgi:hypothetical protein
MEAALELLPRRPERIVIVDVVDTTTVAAAHEDQLHHLDAFVPIGSRVIYLRRQSQTLRAAEFSGRPYVLMLATVIWHEMAHTDGLDERQAQQREEDLWRQFVHRNLVDSGIGLTYLNELTHRR